MLPIINELKFTESYEEVRKKLKDSVAKYHLSISELLDVCNVHRSTIFKLIRGGKLSTRSLIIISEGLKKIEEKNCDL